MADIDPRPTSTFESPISDEDETRRESWRGRAPFLVWLLASAGFLGYLAFGSIEARIWSYGRLFFQDRKIVHVWAYFGDRLPDMPASPLTPVLYYLSIGVMVAGTVLGLWYLLVEVGDHDAGPAASPTKTSFTPDPPQHHG